MAELKLTLLGKVEIHRDGAHITGFSTRKDLALLCYLAVTGRPHSRPALAGLLWGELAEASARANLRNSLSKLRRLVGPHLEIGRKTVAFNREAPYWLDVEVFESGATHADMERRREAVRLYGGDFLEGLFVRQAPAFEDWVLAQGARLRELALQALHALSVHYAGLGAEGLGAGIDTTTRLLMLEPWREEAHRQLMLLQARSGQSGAALAQYETCRRVLLQELGVEPGTETTALYRRIRDGDQTLRVSETLRVSAVSLPAFIAGERRPGADGPVERPIFVARERELDWLDRQLGLALAGEGRVAFVTGGPGRGKTALIHEFARRAMAAHPDLLVASGNCNAYSGVGDPYLPFREILATLSGDVEGQWAAGAISGEHARRLWSALPQAAQALLDHGPYLINTFVPGQALLSRSRAAVGHNPAWLVELGALCQREGMGPSDLPQAAIFQQLTHTLHALAAQHPLLLLVDDLQWADAGSAALLFHLVRRLPGVRLLVLGAYRPEEVASRGDRGAERHPLEKVVAECQRDYGEVRLDLTQADETGGRGFVAALLDSEPNRLDSEYRERMYQRTGGHPLFTAELLREMQARGDLARDAGGVWAASPALDWEALPPRVEAVIAERLDRLDGALRQLLTVASVEGETFTAQVVAQVLAQVLAAEKGDEGEVLRALSRDLGPGGQRLVWERDETRVGGAGRFLSRYRFAHALFQEYLYGNLGAGERRLLHGQVGTALERLHGEHSDGIAAPLAHHYDRAGMREKAIEFAVRAGEQARRAYAGAEARAHYQRALELLGPPAADLIHPKEGEWRVTALTGLGRVHFYETEGFDRAAPFFREAIAAGRELGLATSQLLLAYYWLSGVLFWQMAFDEAISVAEEALTLPDDDESVGAAMVLTILGHTHHFQGNLEAGRACSRRVAQLLQRLPYSPDLRSAYDLTGTTCMVNRDVEGAMGWWQILEEKAIESHDLRALAEVQLLMGWAQLDSGDLHRAVRHMQRAEKTYTRIGDARHVAWSLSRLSRAFLFLGLLEQAQSSASRALTAAHPVPMSLARANQELGLVYLGQGVLNKAIEALCNVLELNQAAGHRENEGLTSLWLGRAHLAEGRMVEALSSFQKALALAAASETNPSVYALACNALSGLEEAHEEPEGFRAFCRRFCEQHPQVGNWRFTNWCGEPAEPYPLAHPLLIESFGAPLSNAWSWQDPFEDCAYSIASSRSIPDGQPVGPGDSRGDIVGGGLRIHAANGRDLWDANLSAPRLLRPAPAAEDWAAETVCGIAMEDRPAIGGLLLWKTKENYLALNWGVLGPHEITFGGCLENEDVVFGRGRLPKDAQNGVDDGASGSCGAQKAPVWLRLERAGQRVKGLYSADGQAWFTLSSVPYAFNRDAPVQVGLLAIGLIDRTIYRGAFPEGTAIRFQSFEVWVRDQ